jgi:hypothetical protein
MPASAMPDGWSGLIERVEGLKAGDREVDAQLWLFCTPGATRRKSSYLHKASGRQCEIDETRDATHRLVIVPEYTSDLDAAVRFKMAVFPGGWWCVEGEEGEGRAIVAHDKIEACSSAPTPAAFPAQMDLSALPDDALVPFGWAPGGYMFRCLDCTQERNVERLDAFLKGEGK